MKPTFFVLLLYLFLSLLIICDDSAPAPDNVLTEVTGPDCNKGWNNLKPEESDSTPEEFVGQVSRMQQGYVTVNINKRVLSLKQ